MMSKCRAFNASRLSGIAVATVIAGVLGLVPRQTLAAVSCEQFADARLPIGVVTAAQSIPAGSYAAPDGNTYPNLPAFCRVTATLTPTPESNIGIELWMPSDPGEWNGRFVGTGNGGYAGAIFFYELASTLPLGFAVMNTDMGTSPAKGFDGRPLTGFPQKQVDFGYRSTHLMTEAGKMIVEAFYGRGPEYSYFTGCSTGGGQALHEAEQFPDDYDGIVGGDPGENRTNATVNFIWDYAATHTTPQSVMPASLLQAVTASVLDQCRVSSGGLPTDGFLTDPRSCHWDARELLCKPGQVDGCLNDAQAAALNLIYDGPRNPRTGALIFPGQNRGSEAGALFDNNAGYTWDSTIQKTSDEQFQAMLDVHLVAPFRILRAAAEPIRAMARREAADGREVFRKVVNVSSIAGLGGNAGQVGYASAKAAVVGLTRTLCKEWGRYKVNVNCVAFGLIETRLTQPIGEQRTTIDVAGREINTGIQPKLLETMHNAIPLGRAGTPEEAADAVYLFCTPEANYISGQVLVASGGLVI